MPRGAESHLLLPDNPPTMATPQLHGCYQSFSKQGCENPSKFKAGRRTLGNYLENCRVFSGEKNAEFCMIIYKLCELIKLPAQERALDLVLEDRKMISQVCSYGCATTCARSPVGNCSTIKKEKYRDFGFTCSLLVETFIL